MVEVGNYVHILVLVFTALLNVGLYFILRNKSKETIYKVILIWCFCNFALHFLKQFAYMSVGDLRKSTAENICAVSTLVFPFIMMYKKQGSIHDFMFMIGLLGGFAGVVYPTEAIGKTFFCFETLRFFFCHISLFSIVLQLAIHDIYRPKLKNFWKMPIYFLVYETIIYINTALILFAGLTSVSGLSVPDAFFSRQYLNNSFVFGPTFDMGVLSDIMGKLCPFFLRTDYWGIFAGKGGEFFWPIIWIAIPSCFIFIPLYLLTALPFNIKEIKFWKKKVNKKVQS